MRPILYYVHHHGHGHWRRALAVAAHLPRPVVLASSLPPPWPLPSNAAFLPLPLDSPAAPGTEASPGGRLHWAPEGHHGLMDRHLALLGACSRLRPAAAVVDVSVEIVVLLRLSGVPVLAVRQPGGRHDPAHELGFDLAENILMPVPQHWGMHCGLERTDAVGLVGGPPSVLPPAHGEKAHAVVLLGAGGSDFDTARCAEIARDLPDWRVTVLGSPKTGPSGEAIPSNLSFLGLHADPMPWLTRAQVILGHAGLGTIGDVATVRRPFVVSPVPRPFGEQHATAAALVEHGHAAAVATAGTSRRWRRAVETAVELGPVRLPLDGAPSFAAAVERVASRKTFTRPARSRDQGANLC